MKRKKEVKLINKLSELKTENYEVINEAVECIKSLVNENEKLILMHNEMLDKIIYLQGHAEQELLDVEKQIDKSKEEFEKIKQYVDFRKYFLN